MSSSDQGQGGYEMGSSSLHSDLKFLLVAFCLVVVLGLFFWRLHQLTVSGGPQDMLPISGFGAGTGAGKAALRQRDISALPVFVHCEASADMAGVVECAVCLAEMRDGERGRLLPGCGHRFHVECIDRWFRANSTCPLCRASAAEGQTDAVEANKDGSVVVAPVVLLVQG